MVYRGHSLSHSLSSTVILSDPTSMASVSTSRLRAPGLQVLRPVERERPSAIRIVSWCRACRADPCQVPGRNGQEPNSWGQVRTQSASKAAVFSGISWRKLVVAWTVPNPQTRASSQRMLLLGVSSEVRAETSGRL